MNGYQDNPNGWLAHIVDAVIAGEWDEARAIEMHNWLAASGWHPTEFPNDFRRAVEVAEARDLKGVTQVLHAVDPEPFRRSSTRLELLSDIARQVKRTQLVGDRLSTIEVSLTDRSGTVLAAFGLAEALAHIANGVYYDAERNWACAVAVNVDTI